jgi:hypothetical protein
MICGLNCTILIKGSSGINLLIRILTIVSTKHLLRNLKSDDCFARFESIVSSLCYCGPIAYFDNEYAKQLLYGLDDSVWGMKITTLEESADFATIDTEKLFCKIKSHELFRKGFPNNDTSFSSKALIISAHVDGHDANPITAISSVLKFALFSLTAASDEQ